MIKINEISNHHQWDGITLTESQYMKLLEVLDFSKFHYDVKSEKAPIYPEPYLSEQTQAKAKKEGES
jgi:hypothetical protein